MSQQNNDNIPPPEMQLTEQEKGWTEELMRAMTGPSALPSHFEYAVYAVATRGNTQDAVKRARAMQLFRETYNIQDTVEEGVTAFQEFIGIHPGLFLHVDANLTAGSQYAVMASDFSKFDPARAMMSERNWRVHALFFYYAGRIVSHNLQVLRDGFHILVEGSDLSWDNVDIHFESQMFNELWMHEPTHYKEIRMYNTNSVANMFWSLLKPFMSVEMWSSLRMGCQIEMIDLIFPNVSPPDNILLHALLPSGPKIKLQDLYLQPDYDSAMRHLLAKVQILLEERSHYDKTFRVSRTP